MAEQKNNQKQCAHHWIIDFPHGPTSVGRCKLCGATKEFTNDLQNILDKKRAPGENRLASCEK